VKAVIPCRRPKVTADPTGDGLFTHTCRVPGCGWTFTSVKSAQEPGWHRADHRRAVPAVAVIRSHGAEPYHVECAGCGFVRCDGTTTTRSDAEGVRDRHLSVDHGLVSC